MARRSTPRNPLFNGRWFEDEIIILCLRWYFRYKLSYRDLVEMMGERGLPVAHTTILLQTPPASILLRICPCRLSTSALACRYLGRGGKDRSRCMHADSAQPWFLLDFGRGR